jgi:hypothetical protein
MIILICAIPVLTQDISSYVTTSFNICMNLISVICRWLFFTDVSNPRIIRCGLDGSDIQTIVSNITTNISEPNGLSIGKVSRN